MASARMSVWGDPDSVQRMSESFFRGQQFGYLADGLMTNMPDGLKDAIGQAGAALQQMTAATPSANGDTPTAGESAAPEKRPDRR